MAEGTSAEFRKIAQQEACIQVTVFKTNKQTNKTLKKCSKTNPKQKDGTKKQKHR